MSSHAGKRPLDPRARGNSPPGKRNRPLQGKPTALPSTGIQSSQSLQESSCPVLPASVPDGPKLASDHNRPVDSAHERHPQEKFGRGDHASRSVASAKSPNHTGSRASTPTQHDAPPAPSMLPVDSRQHANAAQCRDETANDKPLISMQSLRKLQDRRRAIATQASSTQGPVSATSQTEVKLKAQQMEISQLRKDRDELDNRLKKTEDALERLTRLVNSKEPQQDSLKDLQRLLARLNALEKPPAVFEAQSLQKEIRALKPTEDQLITMEVANPYLQRDSDQLKSPVNQLNSNKAETASGTGARILALEDNMIMSKRWHDCHRNQLDILNTWKTSHSKAITEDLEKLATDKVLEKTEEVKALVRREITEVETRLDQRISSDEQLLRNASSKIKNIESLAAKIQELPQQLANICDKVAKTELNVDKTNSRLLTVQENLQEFHNHPKRIEELDKDMRVGELKRAERGSGINQPSTPTMSSAIVNTLTQNMEQLTKDFKDFQHAQKETRSIGSKLKTVDEQLDNFKQVSQWLDAFKDRLVLENSLQATLAGLDQRILSELHALRTDLDSKIANIQRHQSSGVSETAPADNDNAALVTRIKDIESELDSLSNDFNDAVQKIHEHSATIAVMKDQVPGLFRQQFDPFKSTVEDRFGTLNGILDAHASVLEELKKGFVDTHTATTQALRAKADIQVVEKQIDSVTFALKDLEHRYQNISTEEMHQKMVHWFVQMYPTSATLMMDTAQLQQDVNQLKIYCNEIAWVRKSSGALRVLSQHATQLQALAQQHSLQNQEKMEQAISDVQTGLTKAQQVDKEVQEQVSQITAQVADIRAAACQHRHDFDTINDTLIEPNRDFFGLFGTVLAVLAQLQQVVESLNQSLPGGQRKLDWECYLPSLVEQSKTSTNAGEEAAKSTP